MRLLLALAVVAAAASADHGEVIKRVLSTWNLNNPIVFLEHENTHSNRTKTSIPLLETDSYLPPSKNCQTPGYTGEFCEFPICSSTNGNIPDNPSISDTVWLDGAQLANCTQNYVILIDETLKNIRVTISTTKLVNPQLKLIDSNGNTVPVDDIWEDTPENYEVIYYRLLAGQYTVVPNVDVPTSCNLVVKAQTELTVEGGFTQGDVYTAERNDFPSNVVYQGTPAVLVVHANRNRSPGQLKAVNFVAQQNAIYRPRLLSVRYGCGYEYYFESFTCSVLGEHYFQVEGVTFGGYGFRRVISFDCLPPLPVSSTVAPITTPTAQPRHCANGGMMVKNLDGSQYCYCQGLWWGNDCSKILCLNGGTIQDDNTCRCDDAFNGEHCQNVFCPDGSDDIGFSADHPTLMLVVRGRKQMNDVINQVVKAVNDYLGNLQFDPNYLTTFILVVFNNNKILQSGRYINFDDVVTDLQSVQNNFTSDGDCTDAVFSSIGQAFNLYPNNKSPMYVFTDATPNDTPEAETLIHQLSYWRVPINVVYVPTTPSCTLSPEDSTYISMDNVAKKSMGGTFYMNTITNVYTFFYQHMFSTIYRSQMMLSNDLHSCSSQNQYMAITIDSDVEQLTIIGIGNNLVFTLTPPDSDPQVIPATYSDGQNFIWTKNGLHSGSWLVSFKGSVPNGPCSFKVLQKSRHTATMQGTQYDMFWAFAGALDSNGPTAQPIYGMPLGMSVHLNNYPEFIPPQYVQAGLNIYASRNGIQTEVYASNGIWRDGCTYNFYFPPFTCQYPDETLYFNFYARDKLGMAIQRAGVMNCMHYEATPRPPSECQNGGVWNAQNTTCYCPLGYTGNHCEKVQCFNGGTPMGSQCKCIAGWTGMFCDIPKCNVRGPDPEIIRNYVDMIFAVELTSQGYPELFYLNKYFAELLRDIQSQEPTWITNFVLVGFNSTWGGILHVSPSWNPSGIIHTLDQLAQTPPTDTGCTVHLYRALDNAIRVRPTPAGSYVQIFQTSPADESESSGWGELYEYTRELYMTVTGFLAFNPRGPHGLFCNATNDQFQYLFMLCGSTSSKVYPVQPANIEKVIKVIPLQYSSGLVYAQWSTDCSRTMQVYFPVDAYTQTIQLTTAGNNTEIQVYDSQGRPTEIFEIMIDQASYWSIWEIRKPCDTDWTEVGQYCTRVMTEKMSFNKAHDFCASAGGFLVDDLNTDKHNFLLSVVSTSFWMGLEYKDGTGYVWDRGNNPAVPLNQTNQWWAGGSQPPFDGTKQCVFWNATQRDGNTWTPDDCATQRPFICQKHRYDANTAPTSLDSNVLPAGKWYVNVTTSATTPLYGGCYAEVRVQSKLQVVTGFTTSMSQDWPNNDPVNDSPNNMMITYIHSEDNEHRTPLLTHAMIYDAYNGTFYNAAQYQWRADCSFPWVTQNFACPNGQNPGNEFLVAHVGEDEFGNMFQRITLGHCSPKVLTCGNGGYRSNGQCVCDEYWSGKYCTIPRCVNGGTLDPNNDQRCLCPHGYGGPNCQFDECSRREPYNFSPDQRTLLLVLEATTKNKPAFTQLANNFAKIVYDAMTADPLWFKNYVLITFDSNGVKYEQYTYTNPSAVQSAIMAQSMSIKDDGSCQMNIYSVLAHVLRQRDQIAFPNSQILLVTASGASDYESRLETIEQLSNSEAILSWLYMSSDACGGQPTDPSVPHLVRLAYASNGDVAFIDGTNITQYLIPYLSSRLNAQVLDTPTVGGPYNLTCDKGSWVVQVDKNTTDIYISTTSMFGQIGVKDPYNVNVSPETLFSGPSAQTKLYRISVADHPGIYSITLSSPGACFASIYGVGGTTVYTHFAPTTKNDDTGAHSDGLYNTPFSNTQSVATFHLAGSPGHMGQLQYLEIVQPEGVIRSELYRRTECSWEYYSDPFTCTADIMRMYIYGMDENNQQFRRQQLSFCLNSTLPTNAPVTDTTVITGVPVTSTTVTTVTVPSSSMTPPVTPTNGAPTTTVAPVTTTTPSAPITTVTTAAPLLFDVVFLIDMTQTSQNRYDDMSSFVSTLMASFSVGKSADRVALIPVFGDADWGAFSYADFNTITSQQLLVSYLQRMKNDYTDAFSDQGEFLAASLGVASDPNFMSNGYRISITNHLLVYVTATSTFSDNPSTANILANNTYGVITVATGDKISNQGALQTLAGGSSCAFYGANGNDLLGLVPSVSNLIQQASTNGGVYCGNKIA